MNPSLAGMSKRLLASLMLTILFFGLSFTAPALAQRGDDAEQNFQPIYPSKPSTAPKDEKDDSDIVLPDIVAEEGDFHLAVIDSQQKKIDNQKVLDGIQEIMDETNAKIVVGVDGPTNSWKGGAAQFIRGMTLFGPTSYLLLHDDWPENTDSVGLIQDGWIVIGLILPTEDGTGGEIAIDRAWNVRGDRKAALNRSVEALRPTMDQQDYTQAVIEAVRATTEELNAPKDYLSKITPKTSEGKKILAVAVIGGLLALGSFIYSTRRIRAGRRSAAAAREKRALQLQERLRSQSRKLKSCRLPDAQLPVDSLAAKCGEQLMKAAPSVIEAARATADGIDQSTGISASQLEKLEQVNTAQETLLAAFTSLEALLGGAHHDHRRWSSTISAHKEILEQGALFLDDAKASALDAAPSLRAHLVTDTDVLFEARQWLNSPKFRTEEPVQMLQKLWHLRIGLNSTLQSLATQAKARGINVPREITDYLQGPVIGAERRLDDVATLEHASQWTQSWNSSHQRDTL